MDLFSSILDLLLGGDQVLEGVAQHADGLLPHKGGGWKGKVQIEKRSNKKKSQKKNFKKPKNKKK